MSEPNQPESRRLRVLHVIHLLGETNSQYNEHCLPVVDQRDLSIVTFFPPQLTPHPKIDVFAGSGSLRGFFAALREALDAKDYDAIHVHAPPHAVLVLTAFLLWGRLRELRGSLVYTVHDSFYDYTLRNQTLMVVALIAYARIVFCSHAARDSVPLVWKWFDRGHWTVVQNGADFARVDRRLRASEVTRDPDTFTISFVGRLEKVKDPVALIEAFSMANGASSRLRVIGTGSLEEAIAERVRDLGLEDRVTLEGLTPRDEVFTYLASSDIFVSTSWGEGLPVAVLEAMAVGCPVILSDIPPHREVANGSSMIPLVPPGDVAGFAREIKGLIDLSPEERLALGSRCREHAVANFSLERMHAGMEAVYRGLAGVSRRAPSRA